MRGSGKQRHGRGAQRGKPIQTQLPPSDQAREQEIEPEEVCLLCCYPIEVYAVTHCNHSHQVCATCASRVRYFSNYRSTLPDKEKLLQEARRWENADPYKNGIKAGLKIANKQVAPDLLLLPIATPEAG